MSGGTASPALSVTTQASFGADAQVRIDEGCIAPTDLHRRLFTPGQSELPAHLKRAIATVGPVEGGQHAFATYLQEQGVEALDGLYAASAAKAARQLQADGGGRHWLRFLYLTRQLGRPAAGLSSTLADVATGPGALLAQLETPPVVEVEVTHAFVSEFAQQQRTRLLGYLQRLTLGIRVRIMGSRLAIRRLLDHHDGDLPAPVVARARAHLDGDDTRQRPPDQVASEAIETLGLGTRQAGYWRVLACVCDSTKGSVPQAALAEDVLLDDVSASTIRRRAGRLAELGLVERPRRNGAVHLQPTAAGQAALAEVHDQAPTLLGGGTTRDTPASSGGASDAETPTVHDPPKSKTGPCTPNACEGTWEGDRPTAEGQAAVTGGSSAAPPPVQFLSLHSHHGAAAAAPTSGGIALDERQLGGNTDDRAVGWSFDESRDEVVVEATASPVMAFTAVRLCHALLNEKATAQTLTPENLNGGPDRFDLEGLVISNPYVLRKGRTIGWLKNIDCEGSRFLDRLRQARNELLQACRDVAEQAEDGVYDSDSLGAILRKAHGLQGVLVGLYDLLGYDVVRRLRVPDPWSIDDEAFAHFLLHQTSCSARYGAYTAHRVLYEPRSEKREDALGTPAVDSDDYHGTLAGSWTIVGPDLDGLRDALQEPSHDLTLQDDNLNYADFCLDLDVVDGNRREAVAEVVARLAPYKNLEATRTMTTLLQALSGSTAAAAAALDAMGQAEDTRLLDHGDLARGLATIVDAEYYSAFGPADLVPDIGGRTVSKAVATLIGEQTALSTTALAEAAGVSTQSLRDNRVHFERLAALGFLELMTGDPGCPNEWAFSFPDAGGQPPGSTGENGTAGLGTAIFDQSGWGGESWRLDEAIHEYLLRLVDEYGHDLPVGLDDDRVLTAVTGPPDQRTLQPLLAALPALRPILSLLALLLEESLPVADDSLTVRLGATPTVAGTQQSLATAATD